MAAKVKRTTYLLLASGFALSTCIDSTHAVAAAHSVVVAQDDRHPSSNLTSTADRISGSTEERNDLSIVEKLVERLYHIGGSSYESQLRASIMSLIDSKSISEPGASYSLSHFAAEALFKEPGPAMSKDTLTSLRSHLLDLWHQEGKDPGEVYSYCGLNGNSDNIFLEWGFKAWANYVSLYYSTREPWSEVMLIVLRQAFPNDVKLNSKLIECIDSSNVDISTLYIARELRSKLKELNPSLH